MNITPIIEAVFALIAAIVTAVVVPYIKSRTTAAQQTEIAAWVRIAVTAAEQIYNGTGRGQEKKKYVEDWLKAHGVTVDSEKLDAMIDSAVYELKNGFLTIGRSAGNPVTRGRKETPQEENRPKVQQGRRCPFAYRSSSLYRGHDLDIPGAGRRPGFSGGGVLRFRRGRGRFFGPDKAQRQQV